MTIKQGPSSKVAAKQPAEQQGAKDRLATDFYLTFSTDVGKDILAFLNDDMSKPPQPGSVNPDAQAWFYNGQRDLLHKINALVAHGETVVNARKG